MILFGMKMIILSKTLFFDLKKIALDTYPYECCGALLGDIVGDKKEVKFLVNLTNNWVDTKQETKNRRFKITSNDYMKCEKIALEKSMVLLGFYHSHPEHPPVPSETDLKYAWPFFSYPIISVMNKKFDSIKSYVLDSENGTFCQEDCQILN